MGQDHSHNPDQGGQALLRTPFTKVWDPAARASSPAALPFGRPCHRDVTRPDDLPDNPSMPGMAVRYLSTEVFGVCLGDSKLKRARKRWHPRRSPARWEAPGGPLWGALAAGHRRSPPKTRLIRAGTDNERPSRPAIGLPFGPDSP